ncbi:beta-ketoacyl-[acyl-carrier-protein] synthase family protein [Gloeobacter morelensis]|uniref:Beta-ketoacyl-[acyl-carrier-protein] synthase family protein n=1 Tax=Gloeobacter morelensis MG652769 TaxID=2781736 RepID=A0ABY3PRK8_9CYAN|nr:beta-ketoacyl-[acyl-carrier-protein] synthase family protein [Gloeobacter morelensis]UFP96164.1 beta-ketoacyl-[acyl-carrier-protein] synthase family protein [Gloeobacter morelensis MG652769]
MKIRRVVVTGMGTINPIGGNLKDFWSNCCRGTSGVQPISAFEIPDGQSKIAGLVKEGGPTAALVDRSYHFTLTCAAEALQMAGLGDGQAAQNLDPERCGVFLGTSTAQLGSMEQEYLDRTGAPAQPNLLSAPDTFHFNTVARLLARHFNFQGGHATLSTACASALDAIGYAVDAIRCGEVDVAVTGASEAPITPLMVASFAKIGATSLHNAEPQKASRPFDQDRDGFVLAEGCGILVLEALEHALARGARIYAELPGHASTNSYHHMTGIPKDGASIARSAMLALADAGLRPADIDAIYAHGSSTPANDLAESNAFHQLLQERACTVPVTSLKSQYGNPLSASSSIEVIAAVMSINTGLIPPTINLERQDPLIALDVVAPEARQIPVRCVLKTGSGFSGIHSSLIIRQYEGAAHG